MTNKAVKTPKHWEGERYQTLVEVETIYGNKVSIPKRYMSCWHTARQTYEEMHKRGMDHLDFLNSIGEENLHLRTVVAVCYEVYEPRD